MKSKSPGPKNTNSQPKPRVCNMVKCETQMNASPVEMLEREERGWQRCWSESCMGLRMGRECSIHIHAVLVFLFQAETLLPVVVPELRLAMATAVCSAAARLYAWA